MTSLRQRTLWRVFILLIAGTSLLAYYNYRDSSHEIAEVYDAHLAQNARLLQGVMSLPLAAGDRQKLYGAFDAALLQAGRSGIGHPYENKLAFQVWSTDGELLVNTPSAPRIDPQQRTPGFSDITLDGKQWRGFLLPVSEQQVVIWVGERKDVRGDLVNRIVRHTLLPFLLGGLVLALLVWFAIGWGLQPLQNMANVIRGRHAKSLEPLQLAPLPSELEPMQAAINRLLGQVSDLLRREQRFIADAAHEMRTPLAILRLHAQNVEQARTEEDRERALGYLIGGVDRLSRVVNQLLTLARIEPRLGQHPGDDLDLAKVATDTLVEMTPWVLEHNVEPVLDIQPGTYPVRGDAMSIGIALQNLVSNAVDFSPADAVVTISLRNAAEHIELAVEDQGPGIPEERLALVFERFFSDGHEGGAGLGLSIVKTIMEHLGGDVRLENAAGGGLRAILMFPLRQRPAGPA